MEASADELPELGVYSFPAEDYPLLGPLNAAQNAIVGLFPELANFAYDKLIEGFTFVEMSYESTKIGHDTLCLIFSKEGIKYLLSQNKAYYAAEHSKLSFVEVDPQRRPIIPEPVTEFDFHVKESEILSLLEYAEKL